jgi:hypothetical protein
MSRDKTVILPLVRRERNGRDLAAQQSHQAGEDPTNVVDVRRLRLNRAFQQLNRVLADGLRHGKSPLTWQKRPETKG